MTTLSAFLSHWFLLGVYQTFTYFQSGMEQIHSANEGSSAGTHWQLTVPNLSLYICSGAFVLSVSCLKQQQLLIPAFICPLESISLLSQQNRDQASKSSKTIYFGIMIIRFKYGDNSAPHSNEDKVGNSKGEKKNKDFL